MTLLTSEYLSQEESHLNSASFLSIDDRQEHGTVMA